MKCLKKISCILFVVIYSISMTAQKIKWSLKNCIQVGIENNINIKIQKLEIKRTQKSSISLVNELLPNVSLFGSQSYNFGSTIDPGTNARVSSNLQFDNFFLNAKMNLLDFNAIANSQKSKLAIELAKAQKEIIENEYKLQILESFYQALFTQELFEIQKQQLVNTQYNLTRISKEIEMGSKPKSDLYDMNFSFAQEEKQLTETQQLFEIQKIQLFQLMNYGTINVENIQLENEFLDDEKSASLISNPRIIQAQLIFKMAQKELNMERSKNLPTLSTFYQLSSFYYKPLNDPDAFVDTFSNQIGNNKNQQLGLQLSIPVFNGFKNNKAIRSAKIETEKSKLKIEQENLQLNQQLEMENKKKKDFLVLQDKLNQVFQFAEASFKTTQAKFTAGTIDAFSFSIAKNNLLTSEYELLKNKLQSQYTNHKINLIRENTL